MPALKFYFIKENFYNNCDSFVLWNDQHIFFSFHMFYDFKSYFSAKFGAMTSEPGNNF